MPKMMPKTNSILNNAKEPYARQGAKSKQNGKFNQEQNGMNKFLVNNGQR